MKNTIMITGAGSVGVFVAKNLYLEEPEDLNIIIIDNKFNLSFVSYVLKDLMKKVILCEGSITDESFMNKIFIKYNVVSLIHTAAIIGENFTSDESLDSLLETNIKGTQVLLKCSVKYNIERFIFISSGAVYNFSIVKPNKDVDENFTVELRKETIYGATKIFSENLGMYYKKAYGLDFIIIRLCGTIYGPNGIIEKDKKKVWQRILENALENGIIDLNKEQINKEPYLYVNDAALGVVAALKSTSLNHDIYNLSYDLISMEDYIDVLRNQTLELNIIGEKMNKAGYRFGFDYNRAKDDFKYCPESNLNDGIKECMMYWREKNEY